MPYRVIQWGTGNTGSWSIRLLAERPEFELVGVKVYDPEKAGRDAGEVCGSGPIGVLTTTARDQLIAKEADAVLYMASAEMNAELCALDILDLLRSGKNVLATPTPFQNPAAVSPELGAALAQACQDGNATYLGLGLYPGYLAETVPIFLSRICHRIDSLRVTESVDYTDYPSPELMFDVMGFGHPPEDQTPLLANLEHVKALYIGAVDILTRAFDLKIEELRPFRHVVATPTALTVASGDIPQGTVAAMRMGLSAVSRGRELITVEHCTRMDPELAPDWPAIAGYVIAVDGQPSFTATFEFGTPEDDHTDLGCLAAAAHVLNAVPTVVAADAGVLTLAEVPPFVGASAFTR